MRALIDTVEDNCGDAPKPCSSKDKLAIYKAFGMPKFQVHRRSQISRDNTFIKMRTWRDKIQCTRAFEQELLPRKRVVNVWVYPHNILAVVFEIFSVAAHILSHGALWVNIVYSPKISNLVVSKKKKVQVFSAGERCIIYQHVSRFIGRLNVCYESLKLCA